MGIETQVDFQSGLTRLGHGLETLQVLVRTRPPPTPTTSFEHARTPKVLKRGQKIGGANGARGAEDRSKTAHGSPPFLCNSGARETLEKNRPAPYQAGVLVAKTPGPTCGAPQAVPVADPGRCRCDTEGPTDSGTQPSLRSEYVESKFALKVLSQTATPCFPAVARQGVNKSLGPAGAQKNENKMHGRGPRCPNPACAKARLFFDVGVEPLAPEQTRESWGRVSCGNNLRACSIAPVYRQTTDLTTDSTTQPPSTGTLEMSFLSVALTGWSVFFVEGGLSRRCSTVGPGVPRPMPKLVLDSAQGIPGATGGPLGLAWRAELLRAEDQPKRARVLRESSVQKTSPQARRLLAMTRAAFSASASAAHFEVLLLTMAVAITVVSLAANPTHVMVAFEPFGPLVVPATQTLLWASQATESQVGTERNRGGRQTFVCPSGAMSRD